MDVNMEPGKGGLNPTNNSEQNLNSAPPRVARGPRTMQGKERSKHNAIKHGIFSNLPFLHGEAKAQFDSLLNGLREDLKPEGTLEEVLVEKLATLFWRYRRVIVAQGTELPTAASGAFEIEIEIKWDFSGMDCLLRYEASLERSIERTLKQLERLQRMRLGLAVPPSVDVNISS